MVDFTCRTTNVALRLTKLLAQAEKNNMGVFDSGADPVILDNLYYPEFERLERSYNLSETAPVGTQVFRAVAVDRDRGFNGSVVYVLSGGDPDAIFEVNRTTG